jgi:hypothetical protein
MSVSISVDKATLREELELIKETKPGDINPEEVAKLWKDASEGFDAMLDTEYAVLMRNPRERPDPKIIQQMQYLVNDMIKTNRQARRVLEGQQEVCGQNKRWWIARSLSILDGIGGLCNVGLMLKDLILTIENDSSLSQEAQNTTTIAGLSQSKPGTSIYQIVLLVIQAATSRIRTHLHGQEERYKKELSLLEDIVGKGESRAKIKHSQLKIAMLKERLTHEMNFDEIHIPDRENRSSSEEKSSPKRLNDLRERKNGCLSREEVKIDLLELKNMDESLSRYHERYMSAMESGQKKLSQKGECDFSREIHTLSTVLTKMVEILDQADELPTKMPDLSCQRACRMWIEVVIEALAGCLIVWGLINEIEGNTDIVLRVFILGMGLIVFFYSKGTDCFLIEGNNQAFAVMQVKRLQGLRRYLRGVEDLILFFTLCKKWKEAQDERSRKKAYIEVYKHLQYGSKENAYSALDYRGAKAHLLLDSDGDKLCLGDSDTTETGMTRKIMSERKKIVEKLCGRKTKNYPEDLVQRARQKADSVRRQSRDLNDVVDRSRSGSVDLKDRVKLPTFQSVAYGVIQGLREQSSGAQRKPSMHTIFTDEAIIGSWHQNRFWKVGGDSDAAESETTLPGSETEASSPVRHFEHKELDEEEEKVGGV